MKTAHSQTHHPICSFFVFGSSVPYRIHVPCRVLHRDFAKWPRWTQRYAKSDWSYQRQPSFEDQHRLKSWEAHLEDTPSASKREGSDSWDRNNRVFYCCLMTRTDKCCFSRKKQSIEGIYRVWKGMPTTTANRRKIWQQQKLCLQTMHYEEWSIDSIVMVS